MSRVNRARLFNAKVIHRRVTKPWHQFGYHVVFAYVDLDEVTALNERHFLLRLPVKDYGPEFVTDAEALKQFVRVQTAPLGGDVSGPVCLLTMPSLLGRRFNPISLFVCHDKQGRPSACLYEVRNTFGEKHHYPASLADGPHHRTQKQFHVSPFLDMAGHYRFALHPINDGLHFSITKVGQNGAELYTNMRGTERPLSNAALLQNLFGLTYQGVRVLFGIHYEALRLWIKGAQFHRHPNRVHNAGRDESRVIAPSTDEVTP